MKSNLYLTVLSLSTAAALTACSAGFSLNGKNGSEPTPTESSSGESSSTESSSGESSSTESSGEDQAAAPDSAGSPAPAGEQTSDSGPSDRTKEVCTHKGELSALCVEVVSRRHDPEQPDHWGYVRGCFEDVWAYEKNVTDGHHDPQTRTSAAEALALRPDLAGDKYVQECMSLTTRVYGKGWSKHVDEVNARREFVDKVGYDVQSNFKKKCGVRASINGMGNSVELVLEKANKKKAVFYKGTRPDGGKVTVRCDGSVTTRLPGGGTQISQAQTDASLADGIAEFECLQKCARTNETCIAERGNVTASACRNACLPECSK